MSFKLPKFTELNSTQKTIINLLPKSNKLAVIGGPGTGKTIIGLQAAALMAESGKKCLFLSYSKTLKYHLSCVARKFNLNMSNITINSYHSWMWNFLTKKCELTEEKIKKDLQIKPYNYDLKKLETLILSLSNNVRVHYDYIFIDEAQDVQDGLIKILKLFSKNIIITYDDSQKVGFDEGNVDNYDHSNLLIDLGIGDSFYDLIDNYRNTRQTELVAKTLFLPYDVNGVSLLHVTSKNEGEKPKILHANDNQIEKIVNYIVDRFDFTKSVGVFFDIVNLEESKTFFDSLCVLFKKKCKERNIKFRYKYGRTTNITDENSLDNAIFLMTIRCSKGLEYDDVYIFTHNTDISDYKGKNALFVAFTRAKHNTIAIVFENGKHSNNPVYNLIKENGFLFMHEDLREN